jgi:hypothetical protein
MRTTLIEVGEEGDAGSVFHGFLGGEPAEDHAFPGLKVETWRTQLQRLI